MIRPIIRFTLLVTLVAGLHSCKEEIPAGGACSYTTKRIPGVVVAIVPLDSPWYDLRIAMDKQQKPSWLPDTLSYIGEAKQWLNAAMIREQHIVPGKKYTYEFMDITKGSCTPHITRLRPDDDDSAMAPSDSLH